MTTAEKEREVLTVTEFERITKSPETLGAFLRSLWERRKHDDRD